jgi:hypothetical protein
MRAKAWIVTASIATAAVLLGFACALVFGQSVSSGVQSQTTLGEAKALLDTIPDCSSSLVQPLGSQGKEPHFMGLMRKLGVARAMIDVGGTAGSGGMENPKIAGRLYFRLYDGSRTQIADAAKIKLIRASGLEQQLDRIAIEEAEVARQFNIDSVSASPFEPGDLVHFRAAFVSQVWMPRDSILVSVGGPLLGTLDGDAWDNDLAGVSAILQSTRVAPAALNRALSWASSSIYDNSAVIGALVAAGADPNRASQLGYGDARAAAPPIFAALGSGTCNLEALIAAGAKTDVLDSSGLTPLQVARGRHYVRAIALLQSVHDGRPPGP